MNRCGCETNLGAAVLCFIQAKTVSKTTHPHGYAWSTQPYRTMLAEPAELGLTVWDYGSPTVGVYGTAFHLVWFSTPTGGPA